LLRAFLTIAMVAIVSMCIVHFRDAQADRTIPADLAEVDWVRTVDGWESSTVLQLGPRPQGTPPLHPVLVATLQLGISLFALLALPTANLAVRKSLA